MADKSYSSFGILSFLGAFVLLAGVYGVVSFYFNLRAVPYLSAGFSIGEDGFSIPLIGFVLLISGVFLLATGRAQHYPEFSHKWFRQ